MRISGTSLSFVLKVPQLPRKCYLGQTPGGPGREPPRTLQPHRWKFFDNLYAFVPIFSCYFPRFGPTLALALSTDADGLGSRMHGRDEMISQFAIFSLASIAGSPAYEDERSGGDVHDVFLVEKPEKTPSLLLKRSGIPAIIY